MIVLRDFAVFAGRASRPAAARLFAAVLALCCASVAPAAAQATPALGFEQGLLWKIEKPGTATSYLFGTIHIADPRVTALPGVVQRAFDDAHSYTMEVSLEPSSVGTLALRMVYSDGRDLPRVAGQPLFERAAAALADYGLPPEALRMFKPWAAMLLLSVPPQAPEDVLDYRLYRAALEEGKPAHFLESMDEQIAVLEGMPEVEQVQLLQATVDAYPDRQRQIDAMIRAYLARDLGRMRQIGEQESHGDAVAENTSRRFEQRLLLDRNVRMMQRMQSQLREGNAFIAIGALHLEGARGVPALLQAQGWRVTPVY